MGFQTGLESEPLGAQVALEGSLARVDQHVGAPGPLERESLPADITRVRPDAPVAPQVEVEVVLPAELEAALGALERSLTRVDAKVHPEKLGSAEGFGAHGALQLLARRVDGAHVLE